MLYLLAANAGMTIEQVIAGSACWRCIADFQAAELFLLNQIATDTAAAAAAAGQVQCGAADPVAAPTGSCSLYYNTSTTALFEWIAPNWVLKV